MKKFLLFLLFVALVSVASADMTIVQNVKSGGMMGQPPTDTVLTIFMKGDMARVNNGDKPNDPYSVINLKTGKMYMVNPTKQEIMTMSTDMIKQAGKMMGGQGQAKSTVQKTGNSKTINGYKCDEYAVTTTGPMMSMSGDIWATSDVDTTEFQKFKNFAGQDLVKMFGGEELNNIKGMAILTHSKITMMGQKAEATTEVKSVSKDPVPDSMFVLPKDYKMTEMPGMGGQQKQ